MPNKTVTNKYFLKRMNAIESSFKVKKATNFLITTDRLPLKQEESKQIVENDFKSWKINLLRFYFCT